MDCYCGFPESKAELNERGLTDRLELDGENRTVQHTPSPEPSKVLPSLDMYHDLNRHSKLPPFGRQNLRYYFERFNQRIDAFKKLYEARCLHLIRFAFVHNYYYIKGFVKKIMKNLHYQVDVKIDAHGLIKESYCECPAGAGNEAHCEHVGVVLFAVLHVVKYKRLITTETKTQQLQTFSRPRRFFSGHPVKAEDLTAQIGTRSVIFEPYPLSKIDKKGYNDRFRNLVLNFKSNMPMKQLYAPVNPEAVLQDNCYLKPYERNKNLN